MTEAERKQILSMISDGKITAEEGFTLISSLNEDPEEETQTEANEVLIGEVEPAPYPTSGAPTIDANTRAKMERSKGWWDLAAGFGLIILVASAYGMYAIQTTNGLNFWFFSLLFPMLLGVLLLILGLPNKDSKWVFVQVESPNGSKMIVFSFPLSLVRDILDFVMKFIPGLRDGAFQDFFDAIESPEAQRSPIFINVDDDGDKIKIFIG